MKYGGFHISSETLLSVEFGGSVVEVQIGDWAVWVLDELFESLDFLHVLKVALEDWELLQNFALRGEDEELKELEHDEIDVGDLVAANVLAVAHGFDERRETFMFIHVNFLALLWALILIAGLCASDSQIVENITHLVGSRLLLKGLSKEVWIPFISDVSVDCQGFSDLEGAILEEWKIWEIESLVVLDLFPLLSGEVWWALLLELVHVVVDTAVLKLELDGSTKSSNLPVSDNWGCGEGTDSH